MNNNTQQVAGKSKETRREQFVVFGVEDKITFFFPSPDGVEMC